MTGDAYVPLFFAPGDAYQFDWNHEILMINHVMITVKVALGQARRIIPM